MNKIFKIYKCTQYLNLFSIFRIMDELYILTHQIVKFTHLHVFQSSSGKDAIFLFFLIEMLIQWFGMCELILMHMLNCWAFQFFCGRIWIFCCRSLVLLQTNKKLHSYFQWTLEKNIKWKWCWVSNWVTNNFDGDNCFLHQVIFFVALPYWYLNFRNWLNRFQCVNISKWKWSSKSLEKIVVDLYTPSLTFIYWENTLNILLIWIFFFRYSPVLKH